MVLKYEQYNEGLRDEMVGLTYGDMIKKFDIEINDEDVDDPNTVATILFDTMRNDYNSDKEFVTFLLENDYLVVEDILHNEREYLEITSDDLDITLLELIKLYKKINL